MSSKNDHNRLSTNTGIILLILLLAGTITVKLVISSMSPEITVETRADSKPLSININTAAENELTCLPGIGPVKAKRIIAYRRAHGPFRSVKDLEKVEGLGPDTLSIISDLIRVEP